MARIPETELERLKSEVSVQRLAEASGVELKTGGKDWLGRCPLHEDDTASLVVSPGRNLWRIGISNAPARPDDKASAQQDGMSAAARWWQRRPFGPPRHSPAISSGLDLRPRSQG